MTDQTTTHYRKPGWFTQNVFNRFVAFMTRRGISVWGSRGARSARTQERRDSPDAGEPVDL